VDNHLNSFGVHHKAIVKSISKLIFLKPGQQGKLPEYCNYLQVWPQR